MQNTKDYSIIPALLAPYFPLTEINKLRCLSKEVKNNVDKVLNVIYLKDPQYPIHAQQIRSRQINVLNQIETASPPLTLSDEFPSEIEKLIDDFLNEQDFDGAISFAYTLVNKMLPQKKHTPPNLNQFTTISFCTTSKHRIVMYFLLKMLEKYPNPLSLFDSKLNLKTTTYYLLEPLSIFYDLQTVLPKSKLAFTEKERDAIQTATLKILLSKISTYEALFFCYCRVADPIFLHIHPFNLKQRLYNSNLDELSDAFHQTLLKQHPVISFLNKYNLLKPYPFIYLYKFFEILSTPLVILISFFKASAIVINKSGVSYDFIKPFTYFILLPILLSISSYFLYAFFPYSLI